MIPRRYIYQISLGFVLWTVAVVVYFSPLDRSCTTGISIPHVYSPQHPANASTESSTGVVAELLTKQEPLAPALSGAFKRFPRVSELSPQQRRLSVIGVWNGDDNPGYLRHFLHGIQMNADVIDLLFINRKTEEKNTCLDFEKENLNVTWGGNIKVVCIEDADWKRRHVDFLCGKEYGWGCNATEYDDVTKEFATRTDVKNYHWRPWRGWLARDLLQHPENPFWAWMDLDVIPGNFKRYPFNLLSQLSFLTGDSSLPGTFFLLMGQLTAFNYDDPDIGSAWKKFPEMKTPAHFTKYIEGKMPNSPEEKYWSHGYIPSSDGLPGTNLSWGIYPDIHGDDFFDQEWTKYDASETYVISGRDILLVKKSYTREEIETLLRIERSEPIDEFGSVGWTTGDTAIVNEEVLNITCTLTEPRLKHCVEIHPLTRTNPPVYRPSWIHFKDQAPNTMWRRLERDTRPRGYERKLIRHHLFSKKKGWWKFPPMEIKEDMVYRYNMDSSEVWRMGRRRNETLFLRKNGETPIG